MNPNSESAYNSAQAKYVLIKVLTETQDLLGSCKTAFNDRNPLSIKTFTQLVGELSDYLNGMAPNGFDLSLCVNNMHAEIKRLTDLITSRRERLPYLNHAENFQRLTTCELSVQKASAQLNGYMGSLLINSFATSFIIGALLTIFNRMYRWAEVDSFTRLLGKFFSFVTAYTAFNLLSQSKALFAAGIGLLAKSLAELFGRSPTTAQRLGTAIGTTAAIMTTFDPNDTYENQVKLCSALFGSAIAVRGTDYLLDKLEPYLFSKKPLNDQGAPVVANDHGPMQVQTMPFQRKTSKP